MPMPPFLTSEIDELVALLPDHNDKVRGGLVALSAAAGSGKVEPSPHPLIQAMVVYIADSRYVALFEKGGYVDCISPDATEDGRTVLLKLQSNPKLRELLVSIVGRRQTEETEARAVTHSEAKANRDAAAVQDALATVYRSDPELVEKALRPSPLTELIIDMNGAPRPLSRIPSRTL